MRETIKETNGCLGGVYTLYAAVAVVAGGASQSPPPPLTLLCMRSLRVDSVRVIYGDEYILLLCARRIYTRRTPPRRRLGRDQYFSNIIIIMYII